MRQNTGQYHLLNRLDIDSQVVYLSVNLFINKEASPLRSHFGAECNKSSASLRVEEKLSPSFTTYPWGDMRKGLDFCSTYQTVNLTMGEGAEFM